MASFVSADQIKLNPSHEMIDKGSRELKSLLIVDYSIQDRPNIVTARI